MIKLSSLIIPYPTVLLYVLSYLNVASEEYWTKVRSYKNGNSVLHMLAENEDYSVVKAYIDHLGKLDENCRLGSLNKRNRKGETAFFLAQEKRVKQLLGWSNEQTGWYHLSTPPTVLIMGCKTRYPWFDELMSKFSNMLSNQLKVNPITLPDLKKEEILREIEKTHLQTNMSALIVFYSAHGFSGFVQTKDDDDDYMRIQEILNAMCQHDFEDKPKVSLLHLYCKKLL